MTYLISFLSKAGKFHYLLKHYRRAAIALTLHYQRTITVNASACYEYLMMTFYLSKLYSFMIVEEGLPLGLWISRQPKPVKLPEIVRETDGKNVVLLKVLIRNMICPEPVHRCPIQLVSDTLRICYGKCIHVPKTVKFVCLNTGWGSFFFFAAALKMVLLHMIVCSTVQVLRTPCIVTLHCTLTDSWS